MMDKQIPNNNQREILFKRHNNQDSLMHMTLTCFQKNEPKTCVCGNGFNIGNVHISKNPNYCHHCEKNQKQ